MPNRVPAYRWAWTADGRRYMVPLQAFREIPYPRPDLAARGITLALSGWCSDCGVYLSRRSGSEPILDPGTLRPHSHPRPWQLGPRPG
jgi:hypothetical protein